MSPTKSSHRSPLDFLARKVSKSRQNLSQESATPELFVQPPPTTTTTTTPYPDSPILHTNFRTSTATATYSNATGLTPRHSYLDGPPSPSVYSADFDFTHYNEDPSSEPGPSSLQRSTSSTSARATTRYSSNFSRPTPPRTPESEKAKREVINRVRLARSSENVSLNNGLLTPSPSGFQYRQQIAARSATNVRLDPPASSDVFLQQQTSNPSAPKDQASAYIPLLISHI